MFVYYVYICTWTDLVNLTGERIYIDHKEFGNVYIDHKEFGNVYIDHKEFGNVYIDHKGFTLIIKS